MTYLIALAITALITLLVHMYVMTGDAPKGKRATTRHYVDLAMGASCVMASLSIVAFFITL